MDLDVVSAYIYRTDLLAKTGYYHTCYTYINNYLSKEIHLSPEFCLK